VTVWLFHAKTGPRKVEDVIDLPGLWSTSGPVYCAGVDNRTCLTDLFWVILIT